MKRSLLALAITVLFSAGCATHTEYDLHGSYESKNNSLNLVSQLWIWKSGNYNIFTSTFDHEKETIGSGNHYCITGTWKQKRNKITLTPDTYEDKLLWFPAENGSIDILEKTENLANPTMLLILQPSGATMSDISATDIKARKANNWSNYQRLENTY